MRYDTTISYQNKRIAIKVTNKAYSGNFELPDFLRAVRIAKGHDLIRLSKEVQPWSIHQCEAFESGKEPIPKLYLSGFVLAYLLPMKIQSLGVIASDIKIKESPLALRLRELRLKEGYTQEQCAGKINVAQSTYAGYETSKSIPDLPTLIKIADLYGASLDYLSGRYDKH